MTIAWNRILGIVAAAALAFAGMAGAARAAGMAEPKVEYSADMSTKTDGFEAKGKVFHAKGKERMELSMGDMPMIAITRFDKNVSWVLMPAQKQYMENALGQEKDKPRDLRQCSMTMKERGRETVNGISAVRNEIDAECPDSKFHGDAWITKDNIMVKMDATAADQTVKGARVLMELTNLKVGKQDPALFEIPGGYRKFEMPSRQGIMEGFNAGGQARPSRRGMQTEEKEAEPQRQASPPPDGGTGGTDSGSTMEGVGKALRGLFGR